jgi:hypothetical protein
VFAAAPAAAVVPSLGRCNPPKKTLAYNVTRALNYAFALLGIAVFAAMIGTGIVAARIAQLSKDASAYVEDAVPRIVGSWDAGELEKRLPPELLSAQVSDELKSYFSNLSRLGNLRKMGKPVGRVGSGAYPGTRINGRWADYSVSADFDGGPARIECVLQRTQDSWRIATFSVRRVAQTK